MGTAIVRFIVAALCLAPPFGRDCLPPPPPIHIVDVVAAAYRRRRKRNRRNRPQSGGRPDMPPPFRTAHRRKEPGECR